MERYLATPNSPVNCRSLSVNRAFVTAATTGALRTFALAVSLGELLMLTGVKVVIVFALPLKFGCQMKPHPCRF